ncbi:MAG TPA: formate dehydrogenase accessory protein FdhE [Anaeromyxobacteraceae bacterium]
MKRIARDARGEILSVLLPDPAALFDARAARLEALAPGHAAGPWLELLSRLAQAQAAAVREVRVTGGGTLDAACPPRGPAWRAMLRVVLGGVRGLALPAPAAGATALLARASDAELERSAGELLAGCPRDLAAAPFVGAALQACFTARAGSLDPASAPPRETFATCPICGAGPVAGIVLGDERVRYLACGLCGTEWHLPRVQCAACRSTAEISYLSLDVGPDGVSAEACDVCRGYVKLFDLERAHGAEPVADDAATVVLDLLLGERGYHRAGMNLLAPGGTLVEREESTCEPRS